jgi:hypothetical protein
VKNMAAGLPPGTACAQITVHLARPENGTGDFFQGLENSGPHFSWLWKKEIEL